MFENSAHKLSMSEDFVWGVASSAYQIEGATDEDGRGTSIWETFAKVPGATHNGDDGRIACDHYHRYKDDIKLMKDLGVSAYRLRNPSLFSKQTTSSRQIELEINTFPQQS